MSKNLPEDFILPMGQEYDAAIATIAENAKNEGDISLFLGKYRYDRKHDGMYFKNVLYPAALHSLEFEDTDADGKRRYKAHRLANAVTSGMLFGHMVNEMYYPDLLTVYKPYRSIAANPNLMVPQVMEFSEAGGFETGAGRRIAYYAMSQHHLDVLSEESVQSLTSWATELIPFSENYTDFHKGLGLYLYAAWDVYTDRLREEGRYSGVVYAGAPKEDDQGNDTST